MLQDDREYKIIMGKTVTLYHNGIPLRPKSLIDYKKTIELNAIWEKDGIKGFKDRTINQLKKHFSKETIELIKKCDKDKVPIDFMVIYTIKNCNNDDLSLKQKDRLVSEYLKSNINAYHDFDDIENKSKHIAAYKTAKNFTVIYDMNQLTEVSFKDLLPDWLPIKNALNGKKKEQIASMANKFQRLGTALTIGKYSRRLNEAKIPKIFNWGPFKKTKQRLLPAPEKMETIDYTDTKTLRRTMISKDELEAAYSYNEERNNVRDDVKLSPEELEKVEEAAKARAEKYRNDGDTKKADKLEELANAQSQQAKNQNSGSGR